MSRKGGIYRTAKYLPENTVEWMIKYKEPILASHITGIRSLTGVEAEGWFIACPLTPRQLLSLPTDFVTKRLVQCGELAQQLGAGIIGLGAFTSVVGDGGLTVAKQLDIAVTTGNSYTVYTAVQGALDAAKRMGIPERGVKIAVVGATGSIGRTCSFLLASIASELALIGRDVEKLRAVKRELEPYPVVIYDNVAEGLKDAMIIITVTSAVDAVIKPSDLARGCVFCDVARPREVSELVKKERDEVLVIEGGVVAVPGPNVEFGFNFGFAPRTAYACMSETMILALEGRYESFTLGKEVEASKVQEIGTLADKHGFKLAGYRSFERAVSDVEINEIKERAASANTAFLASV